ncbi:hypothetical protein ACFOYW_17795 [Gryllotalpicola reticulitermitis]|uniref:Uncharacterized protein n=1 Tax=Gryllotalpicola reticulitermitis TaxID=1184153 RepID=A0ABV8QCQ9_9MICO
MNLSTKQRKLQNRTSIARRAAFIAAAGAVALTAAISTSAAFADPSGVTGGPGATPPTSTTTGTKTINAYGSNTDQNVYDVFTGGTNGSHFSYSPDSFGSTVASWDATNPVNNGLNDVIKPFSTATDTFQRPDGSGDGRNALSAANNTAAGKNTWVSSDSGATNTLSGTATVKQEEVTFARSSSLPGSATTASTGAQLKYIPQAKDAVGLAEQKVGSATAITNFTDTELKAIYTDTVAGQDQSAPGLDGNNWNVGDIYIASNGAIPVYITTAQDTATPTGTSVIGAVPQASSGTRSFFLSAINVATLGSGGVANETGSTHAVEENDVRAVSVASNLTGGGVSSLPSSYDAIVPFSGASAIEQADSANTGVTNTGVTGSGVSFPQVDSKTVWNGLTGSSAGVGTAQSGAPARPGTSVVGNFARFVFAVVPASDSNTSSLVTWLDTTLESTTGTVSAHTIWTDYGFVPLSTTDASNTSNWDFSPYTN